MTDKKFSQNIRKCSDPRRAKHYFELLRNTAARPSLDSCSEESARTLCSLFAGSQSLSELLVARPDWLPTLDPEPLQYPRRKQGFQKEVEGWLEASLQKSDFAGALTRLREFKQREMLRIGARDLARFGNVPDIIL